MNLKQAYSEPERKHASVPVGPMTAGKNLKGRRHRPAGRGKPLDLPVLAVASVLSVPFGVAVYHGGWVALAVVLLALFGLAWGSSRRG